MYIDPGSTYIYHITNMGNLSGIIHAKGLWSDTERVRQGIENVNIAHNHIKERRRRTPVPVGSGGVVADYVPFYFCPRSPMLYAIHRGQVDGCEHGQQAVVHLCAQVSDAMNATQWCASDGHTDITSLCRFIATTDEFSLLDWEAIRSPAWGYPQFTSDSDKKRRKQAEFLVRTFFPWRLFIGIGVMDAEAQGRVEELLVQSEHKPQVYIKREWYF